MGNRGLFIFCFWGVVFFLAYALAFTLGMLPTGAYVFVYQTFWIRSPQASEPYLTKFQGHWLAEFMPTVVQTSLSQCKESKAVLAVRDAQVTGVFNGVKHTLLEATINENGQLTGRTVSGVGNYGVVTAAVYKAQGKGVWTDASDCRGNFTMKKLEPYEDPSKGFLVSYTGDVTLKRKTGIQSPHPGQSLYGGDEIDVSPNASAYLTIGTRTLHVPAGSQYLVVN